VGAEFFHEDRRTDGVTDMTNVIVAFRNFVKASKNQSFTHKSVKLTDKPNHTYLMCRFVISKTTCFGFLHRPSSGRYRFTKKKSKKTGEASPNKQICMLVCRLTQHFSDKKHATGNDPCAEIHTKHTNTPWAEGAIF